MNITYRQAGLRDLNAIYGIETACFSRPWSYASLQRELCGNAWALYLLAEADGEAAGYCGMHTIMDEGHILNVAVLPQYRRHGIAEGLLITLFKITRLSGYTLEVRITNHGAVSLYQRLGFEVLGRRPKYYGDEDALIMWKGKSAP